MSKEQQAENTSQPPSPTNDGNVAKKLQTETLPVQQLSVEEFLEEKCEAGNLSRRHFREILYSAGKVAAAANITTSDDPTREGVVRQAEYVLRLKLRELRPDLEIEFEQRIAQTT